MTSKSVGVGLGTKGLFKRMPAANPSSLMSCTDREETSPLVPSPALLSSSLSSELFRPWALALIGLALSVSLWGFGYKLSRYNPHPDASSRALFAKMWDKHQDVSQLTAATQASVRSFQSQLVVDAVLLLLLQPPNPEHRAGWPQEERKGPPVSVHPVVPLRSPPSNV